MTYDFNGKKLNIPDKDIDNLMKTLDLTKEEAIETWLDDNDYTTNEIVEELTAKAKKEIKRYEKSEKVRKPSTKERKVDTEKKAFLDGFRIFAEGKGGVVTSIKNEAEFSFTFNGNEYSVKLIKHRAKKD